MVSFIQENYVRCVWPGASLPLGQNGKYMVDFFKEKYDITIEYLEETKTLPGNGKKGSRIDQIFNVQEDSIDKFEEIKSKIGALYAKEVVENNDHHIYIERIYLMYFQRSEKELIKEGKLSKEDAYQVIKNK